MLILLNDFIKYLYSMFTLKLHKLIERPLFKFYKFQSNLHLKYDLIISLHGLPNDYNANQLAEYV